MTTKILTGVYDTAYGIAAGVTTLSITATGYLFGGLRGGVGQTQVINDGGIFGVSLFGGSTLANDGTIQSTYRYGAGVIMSGGGAVTNGDATHRAALIEGGTALETYNHQPTVNIGVDVYGAAGTVTNYGSIEVRTVGYGVNLGAGGSVTNGSASDHGALIEGSAGVVITNGVGTVVNFGAIDAIGQASGVHLGVLMSMGGSVTNGSSTDVTASINSVTIYGGVATVINFGQISGPTPRTYGVALDQGGRLTNGSASDTGALIAGLLGAIAYGGPGYVVNDGTIEGAQGVNTGGGSFGPTGLVLVEGGGITNGASNDTRALIEGGVGVTTTGGAGVTLRNFGSIIGGDVYGNDGVELGDGTVINGSATDTAATISGYWALNQGQYGGSLGNRGADYGALIVLNFGTISGSESVHGQGVLLTTADGMVTNGSASDHSALIEGYDGVVAGISSTVTNFGTIAGGYAVTMAGVGSRLNAEAGSVFDGLVLAGGALVDIVGGVVAMSGIGTVGKVEGAGTLALNGSLSRLGTGVSLLVAEITESGGTTIEVSGTVSDSHRFVQTSGVFTVDPGDQMTFSGTGDSFSGILEGGGTLALSAGTDALAGLTVDVAKLEVENAAVTVSGTLDLITVLSTPKLLIATAGATLTGSGVVLLANKSTSLIEGDSAGATLINQDDKIEGAGQLGDGKMKLVNDALATIEAASAVALVINTGTNAVTNAGLIENLSTGGLTIDGAVVNTGTLSVTKGTLAVGGAVSGAGTVRIGGGTADFASTFSEAVAFTVTAGSVLELAKSVSYTGQITGFSKTGASSLDLLDIAFGTKTTATFSGTTAFGTLTVTDGTHTAKITLEGNYTASTFTATSDGHGGTTVTDPTEPRSGGHSAPLVTAMAGFAPSASAAPTLADRWTPPMQAVLVAPLA